MYPVKDVLDILSKTPAHAWSIGCTKDLQKWEMDGSDVDYLVRLAVQSGRYIGSEWCQSKQDGPWAACDAYSVTLKEWSEHAHKDLSIEYYVKLAISKTGQLILLASCHPSES
ncbi:hypothetical protein [Shewanella mangrovisoli]|uniref:hypothetical protein n=1 Tax=Shewanella mangrovisoli TaxID=2864211 RepID=UPI0035BB64DF